MEKEIAVACDHCKAIQEICRVHEVASQLHALFLRLNLVNFKTTAVHENSSCKSSQEVAGEMVQEIMKLNSSTLSRLQSIVNGCCCCCSNSSGEHKRKKRLETTMIDSLKIRRRREETWSAVTTEPYHDGHQWRKYGKKNINNAKYQRSYYRCIHKEEEGCLAKKTIQQIEEDGIHDNGETAARRFSVEYICPHTCKLSTAADEVYLLEPFVMESTTAPISSHSRISTATGSSTACCSSSSKPVDDHALDASVVIDQVETVGEDDRDMEDYWKVFSPIYEGSGWDWEYKDDYVPLGNEHYIW